MGSVRGWFLLTAAIALIGMVAGCVSRPSAVPAPIDPRTDESEAREESKRSSEIVPPDAEQVPEPEALSPDAGRDPDGETAATDPDLSSESPSVTTSLPELPPPQKVPQIPYVVPPAQVVPQTPPVRPPLQVIPPLPRQATPDQMARILAYYGTRSAASVGIDVSVNPIIDLSSAAVRYAHEGLQAGGLSAFATMVPASAGPGSGGEHLSDLEVAVSGDSIAAADHYYGRTALHLTYRTGPGKRLVADAEIRGPYRLSQVSSTDAVLRSLRAIPDSAYRDLLILLDRLWIEEVERGGLPYRIERPPGSEPCSVLPIFEIPPRLWYHLARFLPDSDCQYTVDPLTGIIRIVYNSDS